MLVNRILIGGLFVIVGVVITLFHEHLIKSWDYWNNGLWGDSWWTGKFTRGGKLFLRMLGALVSLYGLLVILGVLS